MNGSFKCSFKADVLNAMNEEYLRTFNKTLRVGQTTYLHTNGFFFIINSLYRNFLTSTSLIQSFKN